MHITDEKVAVGSGGVYYVLEKTELPEESRQKPTIIGIDAEREQGKVAVPLAFTHFYESTCVVH